MLGEVYDWGVCNRVFAVFGQCSHKFCSSLPFFFSFFQWSWFLCVVVDGCSVKPRIIDTPLPTWSSTVALQNCMRSMALVAIDRFFE